jgi:ADP-heptose:LPS heptosyltransferase
MFGGDVQESVIVVRPGSLGDTILTLPLLGSIRARHPNAAVTFLGSRAYKDLCPSWIDFQAIENPRWLWLFGAAREEGPESRTKIETAYVILAHPDDVIGQLRKAGAGQVFHVSSRPPQGKHIVEHLHEGLGLPVPPREPALRHLAAGERRDLIWVHPGSGGQRKCAPLEKLVPLIEKLKRHTGWPAAVTVGEEDAFLMDQALWPRLVEAAGTLVLERRPLREVWSTLGTSRLYVGNDSGISHLAAGLGVASIVLFSASDPAQWSPWVTPEQLTVVDLRGGVEAAWERVSLPRAAAGGHLGVGRAREETLELRR